MAKKKTEEEKNKACGGERSEKIDAIKHVLYAVNRTSVDRTDKISILNLKFD